MTPTNTETDTYSETDRERDIERDRERDTHIQRYTCRHRIHSFHLQTPRETHTERQGEIDTERDKKKRDIHTEIYTQAQDEFLKIDVVPGCAFLFVCLSLST